MKITIALSDDQARSLEAAAERFGLQPEQLAQAALSDLLAQPREEFQQAAEYVLDKNRELYRRLA
jgi:antitoxin FitA